MRVQAARLVGVNAAEHESLTTGHDDGSFESLQNRVQILDDVLQVCRSVELDLLWAESVSRCSLSCGKLTYLLSRWPSHPRHSQTSSRSRFSSGLYTTCRKCCTSGVQRRRSH
jgi:hypothetical protein